MRLRLVRDHDAILGLAGSSVGVALRDVGFRTGTWRRLEVGGWARGRKLVTPPKISGAELSLRASPA